MFEITLTIVVFIIMLLMVPGYTPKIKGRSGMPISNSIAELRKIRIGNSFQYILIRSENINNPILLFVHGGPGTSQLTLMRNNTQAIEKYFTVVNWDQRGAAKSYNAIKDINRMNINQFISDINELSEYLIKRFNKTKIILAGHSWGSVIGALAVYKQPKLYSAYIGIGQMSNVIESEKISYDWTLQQAKLRQDIKSVNKLTNIGAPPYTGEWKPKFLTQRKILGKYGGEYHGSNAGAFKVVLKNLLFSTEYTFVDRINFFRGIFKSLDLLFPELLKVNLFKQVPELKVPVWFMLGRYDFEVPSILSEQYYESLRAPNKTLYWFEKSAHLPNTEEREHFNQILVEKVLPMANLSKSESMV